MTVDDGNDVAEVVRDARGKAPYGFDTLRTPQLLVEILVSLAGPRGFDGSLHGDGKSRKTILFNPIGDALLHETVCLLFVQHTGEENERNFLVSALKKFEWRKAIPTRRRKIGKDRVELTVRDATDKCVRRRDDFGADVQAGRLEDAEAFVRDGRLIVNQQQSNGTADAPAFRHSVCGEQADAPSCRAISNG